MKNALLRAPLLLIWAATPAPCLTAQEIASSPIVFQRTVKGDLAQLASCTSQNISASKFRGKWGIRRKDAAEAVTLGAVRIDSFIYGQNNYGWLVDFHDQNGSQVLVTVRSNTVLGEPQAPDQLWPEWIEPCTIK